ncbi:hypothetical protein HXX76_000723 [Chlamydomonas incerta]|uniref:ARID domain-containing protein n=1 Tax=Chlamydomonas incerta TaxID=51695 RepID=A0A835WEU3_CHLIN|nr:hypothetical protein HXX76_000723 [Chlamydomonas incerta]|eukprot:KAG2446125.1 hypothetical protein HXX76_000723 [Chlamydomonas incerta]
MARWRVLACVPADGLGGTQGAILDLAGPESGPSNAQVVALINPSLSEFNDAVAVSRPNFIFVAGPPLQREEKSGVVGAFHFRGDMAPGEETLLSALAEARPEVAYVDAVVSPHFGPSLHQRGVPNVVVWPAGTAIPTAVAAHYNCAFAAFLINTHASPPEAFAAASHSTQAHCMVLGSDGTHTAPALPAFVGAARPALPDSASIPPLTVPPGLQQQLDPNNLPAFPGWTDVRLLAPRAELRLLLTGGSGLVDSTRLSFLGEALRALLVMEARGLQLTARTPLDKLPRNLPAGCAAARCDYTTSSGAAGSVVLGAPPGVLEHPALVEHALRMTLVTDAVSLQFRLPPPGLSLPTPRSSKAVAGGTPVVDTVVVTSVWAVEVLRSLCKEPRYRSLAALGVAAVGNAADCAFTPADVARMGLIAGGLPAANGAAGTTIAATSSDPASAQAPGGGLQTADTLPSPSAQHGGAVGVGGGVGDDVIMTDMPAALADGGHTYFGADAMMGYAMNGHLHFLGNSDMAAAAGYAAAASPDSPLGGVGDGLGGSGDGAPAGPGAGAADGGGTAGVANGNGTSPHDGWGAGGSARHDKPPNFTGDLPGYTCRRPPLAACSEAQFYDDLCEFLSLLRGKPVERSKFPEAVLNGVSLDLFALYREVVSRGGFRVGNGINWKGQVFPRMRNWTESNKQTGVGNALKRHYQNYLWEYEVAHPEDVTLDRCVLCNARDREGGTADWLCCDCCENWVHHSCDKRPGLGQYKDYTQGNGRVYVCPSCSREQEAGEALKRQRTA